MGSPEDCFIHDDCYDGGGHDVGDDHGWRGVW